MMSVLQCMLLVKEQMPLFLRYCNKLMHIFPTKNKKNSYSVNLFRRQKNCKCFPTLSDMDIYINFSKLLDTAMQNSFRMV